MFILACLMIVFVQNILLSTQTDNHNNYKSCVRVNSIGLKLLLHNLNFKFYLRVCTDPANGSMRINVLEQMFT